jgi:hypothetical protein
LRAMPISRSSVAIVSPLDRIVTGGGSSPK